MPVDDYAEHFDPLLLPEEVRRAAKHMLEHCPVAHSDRDGGFLDSLSRRYTGAPYPRRRRRRQVYVIELDTVRCSVADDA